MLRGRVQLFLTNPRIENLVKICQFFLKILSGNKNPAYFTGHKYSTNVLKIMCNNRNLDLININAYI